MYPMAGIIIQSLRDFRRKLSRRFISIIPEWDTTCHGKRLLTDKERQANTSTVMSTQQRNFINNY